MNPELYRGAMEGNFNILVQHKDHFEVQVTPNKNSVLHVTALFNNNSSIVKKILAAQPLLLCKINSKGETSLHIAAREGHYFTVQSLIECAKEMDNSELENGVGMAKKMLRMVNNEGNTTLHEAVLNNHLNIVKLLVEEDHEFSHPANNDEETPLYIAAERGFEGIMSKILNTCTSPTCSGPEGRTALHGAVINDFEGCTTQLLEWKQSLTRESDIHGCTPLHYAAVGGLLPRVTQLLDADKSAAYLTTFEDNKMTPLHLAVIWGKIETMKVLISQCPDCWEMADSKGQNILHLASINMKWEAIKFILKDSSLSSLINQKNDEGNTPLHLLAAFGLNYHYMVDEKCVLNMIKDPRVDKSVFNKEKRTPFDIAYENNPFGLQGLLEKNLVKVGARRDWRNFVKRQNDFLERWRKAQEEYSKPVPFDIRKTGDTHLIVAAFIATVTFAAGFTVPGGYDGNQGPNQGMAVLTRATAFKAFVISDTVAMILSTCSVFLYFIAAFYDDRVKILNRSIAAYFFIVLAIIAMMVAFMTGMYAVLPHSIALAISVFSIVSFSFLVFFVLLRKFFS